MPIYTYTCEECDSTFSEVRRVVDRNKALRCACGNLTCSRQFESFTLKAVASSAPRSYIEQLAGKRVQAPPVAGPTSVLGHACHSGCGCK